jgi:hypothetical protein
LDPYPAETETSKLENFASVRATDLEQKGPEAVVGG